MLLGLRHKLAVFDNYVNPFNRRGALRLSRYHPRSYLLLTLLAAVSGYLFMFLFPALLLAMPVALYYSVPEASTAPEWFVVTVEFIMMVVAGKVTYTIATLRFCTGTPVTFCSLIQSSPVVGSSSPAIKRISVVFPLKVVPSRILNWPGSTDKSVG